MAERLTFADVDANFDALAHYSGSWSAGTYKVNEVVSHRGGVFICVSETTAEPYSSSDWVSLPLRGQGGIERTSSVTGPNLGSGWSTVPFDATHITGLGVTLTPSTGAIEFAWPGIWWLSATIHLDHDESVSVRDTSIRFYNDTESFAYATFKFAVAKNQTATNFTWTFAISMLEEWCSDTWRLEMGGGSTISSVDWEQTSLILSQKSSTGHGSTFGRFAQSSGIATATGIGSQEQAAGSATGLATVEAVGNQESTAVFSYGTSTASGIGMQGASTGSSSGSSTANAQGMQPAGFSNGSSTAEAVPLIPK